MSQPLYEYLTYDQLFRMSDPKRVTRSFRVKGPPLEIDSYADSVYYAFNFKSYPSTTGLRHRGYIKFLRPRNDAQKPLQHLNCVVDCTCQDFRYRWAWANKQRRASRVGDQSLNQAWNQAPRITNPKSRPGLCKHILAAREYIYGLLSSFPSDEPDTAEKLKKLTAYATKRWANLPQQMQQARDREARYAQGRAARNLGQKPPTEEVPLEEPTIDPTIDDPKSLAAIPPGQRGRNLPAYPKQPEQPKKPAQAKTPKKPAAIKKPSEPTKSIRRIRKGTAPATPTPKAEKTAKDAGFDTTAEYNFRRRQGLGDSLKTKFGVTSVVSENGKETRMNTVNLSEAIKLVEELEQDELDAQRAGDTGGDVAVDAPPAASGAPIDAPGADGMSDNMDMPVGEPGGDLPPSEPPIGDTAIGADTEGATAIGLLKDISNSLKQLSGALVPEQSPEGGEIPPGAGGDMPMGDEEGAPGPEGEGDEIPVEDPSEEAAAEEAGGDEGGGDDEGGEKPPKKSKKDDDSDDE